MSTSIVVERRLITYLGLGTALAIFVVSAWAIANLLHDRDQIAQRMEVVTQNLSQVLEQSLAARTDVIDFALRDLADDFEEQLLETAVLRLADVRPELEHCHARLPELGALYVTDTSGKPIVGSEPLAGKYASKEKRTHFAQLREHADAGMTVSRVFRSDTDASWHIEFARRFNRRDGSLAGFVVATVGADYFNALVSAVKLGPTDAITLRDGEGALIARASAVAGDNGQPGSSILSSEFNTIMASGRTMATYRVTSPIDQVERTLTLRRLQRPPFTLVVGLGMRDAMSEWRSQLHKTIALIAALSVFLLIASWAIWRLFVERQEGSRQQALFKSIVESSDDAIVSKTLDGTITSWNDGAEKLFGYSHAEAVGKTMQIILPPEKQAEEASILDRIKAGESVDHFDTLRRHKDSHLLNVSVTISPIRDANGVIVGASKVARDIAERVRATTQLEHAREMLESRVTERTLQLSEALVKAESATRAKADFLSNMSHEIRTPLNAIVGMARIGERDSADASSGRVFTQITKSSQMLMEVVNDILDFSKIEAGKMHMESGRLSLAELVDAVIIVAAPAARAKGLQMKVHESADMPQTCLGDPLRIKQVLVNLLSNAIKFTEQGQVELSLSPSHDGWLQITIKDSGIGMSAEQIERLFSPFEQADTSTTRRFGGTGLGLSICKRLTDAMNGHIAVSSTPGSGSEFRLRIPLIEADEPKRWPAARIALCGLDEEIADTLRAALAARGMQVSVQEIRHVAHVDLAVLAGEQVTAPAISSWTGHARHLAIRAQEESEPLIESLAPHALMLRDPILARHLCDSLIASHARAELASTEHGLEGYSLIACDDVAINNFLLTDLVENTGGRIICFEDGQSLLAELDRHVTNYDVVLTDIQMPDMDGYEIAQHIRARWPDLPVIGITAHVMDDARDKCRQAGMLAHVAKPIEPDALVKAIQTHVRNIHREIAGSATRRMMHLAAGTGTGSRRLPNILDWDTLTLRYRDKPRFLDKLLRLAVKSLEQGQLQLRAARQSGDALACGKSIHAIKGIVGNVLGHEAYQIAVAAELAMRRNDPSRDALAAELIQACQELCAFIRDRLAEAGNDPAHDHTPDHASDQHIA